MPSLRVLAHIAAALALATVGIALGRWIKHPTVGGLAFLLLTLVVLGTLAWRLYRPGGVAELGPRRRGDDETAAATSSAEDAVVPE